MLAHFIVLFSCLVLGNTIPAYGHGAFYLPPSGCHSGLNVASGTYASNPNLITDPSRHPAAIVASGYAPIGHSHVHHRRNCRGTIRCSNTIADTTYTTDGFYCYKFNNSCQLAYANCERRNALNTVLKSISRHDCHHLPRSSSPY